MAALLAAKPVDGWCSVNLKTLSILSSFLPKGEKPSPFAKEEKKEDKKEEKKEEPKSESEPEKKRSGGTVGSASKRADGCAQRGKTRGKMV